MSEVDMIIMHAIVYYRSSTSMYGHNCELSCPDIHICILHQPSRRKMLPRSLKIARGSFLIGNKGKYHYIGSAILKCLLLLYIPIKFNQSSLHMAVKKLHNVYIILYITALQILRHRFLFFLPVNWLHVYKHTVECERTYYH